VAGYCVRFGGRFEAPDIPQLKTNENVSKLCHELS